MSRSTIVREGAGTRVWTLSGSAGPNTAPLSVRIDRSPFRIGRRPDAELSLTSPVVSGSHAILISRGDTLWARDNSSTNGTYLNGKLLKSEAEVSAGDWLEFGDLTFRIANEEVTLDSGNAVAAIHKTTDFCGVSGQLAMQGLDALIRKRALAACFQPIYYLSRVDIYGYEFLARSSIHGVSNPAAMFAAAEACGREIELSELCRECAIEHSLTLPSCIPIFLNTHPKEDLIGRVVSQLAEIRREFPRRAIVLEIHEAAVTDPEMIREFRELLSAIDVGLAFDDYGAGQARFRELICAPSDYIKFDASLIRDLMDVDHEQRRFFRSIIDQIRRSGAKTIAEGVESEDMAQVCREIGFDLVQGFLFGRPAIMTQPDTATLQAAEAAISRQTNRLQNTNARIHMSDNNVRESLASK